MKILITGSKGQLGTELAKLLPEAILTDVADLDITDEQAVKNYVKEHKKYKYNKENNAQTHI